jgi:hypothetical protein
MDDLLALRSWAFAIQGMTAFLQAEPGHGQTLELHAKLADRLFEFYQGYATDDWPWWEQVVTYDNAKLPHALLLSGPALNRPEMTDAGLRSLRWLIDQQTTQREDGSRHLSVIGNDGWLKKGGQRAMFDQQPLEAYAIVDACLEAARIDPDHREQWEADARMALDWFLGRNDLHQPLYDSITGGGCDGIQPERINQNQGAESTLAYLLSVLEMHDYVMNG